MLTYTDAQYLPLPISDGLWNEQPVVERTRVCIQLSFQAMIPACPCRSYTQYAALEGGDARYSWSHTARSSHACHRHHPRKTFSKEKLLKTGEGNISNERGAGSSLLFLDKPRNSRLAVKNNREKKRRKKRKEREKKKGEKKKETKAAKDEVIGTK